MVTKEQVDKAWHDLYKYNENHFGGPGNGCDDYRDIPDEIFIKSRELKNKAINLQKEYENTFKAIIKKNDNGTYKITDLNGNDYIIHYKIGETEYKNEFIKNLSWSDIQDIISMYRIEFTNYDEIKEENKYVPNDVFRFRISLNKDLCNDEITVYTKPFPKHSLIEYKSEEQWQSLYDAEEDLVREKYFTQQKIDELKNKFIKKIKESDNPFYIYCDDRDGGYNVTEDQLFNLE